MTDTAVPRSQPGSSVKEMPDEGDVRTSVVRRGTGDLGSRGRTTIADGVVEKIAGLAAREVSGVNDMGSGMSRTIGAMRDRVPGTTGKALTSGVSCEVGEVQTAIDLDIIVDYGVAISDVSRAVRENVILSVERMTGLEVVEANIAVSDVKLPEEESQESGTRLQ